LPTSTPPRRPTRWVGLTPDDRRAERRALLLDAAFDLLGTEGWAGTTVRGVCQQARLNPRYFYESFEDLDALLLALYDRLVAELGEVVLQAVAEAGEDPRAQMRAAVGSILEFVDDDPRRGRVLYVEALGNEALNRRRIETGHALVAMVEEAGARRHGRPRKGEQIGRVTAAIIVGGLAELVAAWLDGRLEGPRDRIVEDAADLLLALGDTAATIASGRARRRR